MDIKTINKDWENKLSSLAQLGGIETAVLDNGLSRGSRVAWVNTGSGLRFKVAIDRSMDIAEAFFNEHSLAWLSALGSTPSERFSDRGTDWLRNFGGGLMVTCGLSHVGGPEKGDKEERGLHGRISNVPAELESIIQPEIGTGDLEMSLSGKMRETSIFGPNLLLKRKISCKLGESIIRIQDEVSNQGNESVPHMLLYHCNFGWPLVDKGAKIFWQGDWKARDQQSEELFNSQNDFKTCPDILDSHSGRGEAAAFIDPEPDKKGICCCGILNEKVGLQLELKFKKQQLPWLVNWQHWGKGEYVTGLEPCTCPPIGQKEAIRQKKIILLKPGEKRKYDLEFTITKN